jgi:hypothetical protein
MPSYSETGSFPPLDGRPVGEVPPAPEEKAKTKEAAEEVTVCPRCSKENCRHSK